MSREVKQRYCQLMMKLLEECDRIEYRSEEPYRLRLTQEARELLDDFDEELEPRLAPDGDLASMTDFAGKLVGTILRIAGILSQADRVAQDLPLGRDAVNADEMQRAIDFGRYFLEHARAAYAQMGADPDHQGARKIVDWLEDQVRSRESLAAGITRNQIHQGVKGTLRTLEDLKRPLELVIEYGYLAPREPEKPRGRGRPRSPTMDVNPRWISRVRDREG